MAVWDAVLLCNHLFTVLHSFHYSALLVSIPHFLVHLPKAVVLQCTHTPSPFEVEWGCGGTMVTSLPDCPGTQNSAAQWTESRWLPLGSGLRGLVARVSIAALGCRAARRSGQSQGLPPTVCGKNIHHPVSGFLTTTQLTFYRWKIPFTPPPWATSYRGSRNCCPGLRVS